MLDSTFIFLNGPPHSGKSTLADLIVTRGLMHRSPNHRTPLRLSFIEPGWLSLLATYYPDHLFTDVVMLDDKEKARLKENPLPISSKGGPISGREWLIRYADFLISLHGPEILGTLSLQTCIENEYWHDVFVFDGARFIHDLRPFVRLRGPRSCVLVSLHRKGTSWSNDNGYYIQHQSESIPHFSLDNDSTLDALYEDFTKGLTLIGKDDVLCRK